MAHLSQINKTRKSIIISICVQTLLFCVFKTIYDLVFMFANFNVNLKEVLVCELSDAVDAITYLCSISCQKEFILNIDLTRPHFHTLCTKQLRICQKHVIDIITSTLLICQFLIRFLNTKVGIIAVYIYLLDTKNGNLFSILSIANYVFDRK